MASWLRLGLFFLWKKLLGMSSSAAPFKLKFSSTVLFIYAYSDIIRFC